jgi:hypothetical protein
MRIVLIIGAGICCIPGLYISFGLPYDIIKFGTEDRTAEFALIFYAIYVIMAFAPAILLFKSRKKEMPLSKILAIGAIECFVILGLLAGLAAWEAGI